MIYYVANFTLRVMGYVPEFCQDEIKDLFEEFSEWKLKDFENKALREVGAAKNTLNLRDRMFKKEMELKNKIKDQKMVSLNDLIQGYVQNMRVVLDKTVQEMPPHLKTGANSARSAPFSVYLYGETSIGKTSVFQPLCINEVLYHLQFKTAYEPLCNCIFVRNVGSEY